MAMDSTSQMTVVAPSIRKICIFSKFVCTSLDVICTIFFCIPITKCLCPFPDILLYYRSSCIFLHWLLCTIHFLGCMLCFCLRRFLVCQTTYCHKRNQNGCNRSHPGMWFLKFNTFLILLPASASPNATGANEYGCRSIAKASKDALYPFLI